MTFNFVFDRHNDSRPYPNLAPMMSNPHDSYAGMGDSYPRIAPCRLLLYCEDHAYPYTVSYMDQPLPANALYPVGLAWFDYELDYFALMPATTLAAVRRGEVTVLFYYHEGDNPAREQTRLDQLCCQHGLPENCYRFVSGNTRAAEIDRFVYFADHELFYWRNGVVWNGNPRPYTAAHANSRGRRFTLLSRIHKWWRATVVARFRQLGWLDRWPAFWSYNTIDIGDQYNNNPIMLSQYTGLADEIQQLLAGAPYSCDDLDSDEHNSHWVTDQQLYRDSYASFVLETLYDAEQSGGAFITEKTFKAVLNGHPFVIFGCPGTLATLRSLGYRTFDSHIDNTYDAITDNTQRFEATMCAVQGILDQDSHAWYRQCLPDILHNQQLFVASKYRRLAQLDRELNRDQLLEYSFRSGGFGILIMELSMLMHTGRRLRCYVPSQDHPLWALKRLYQIDDDRMEIICEDRGWHPASNDMLKAFSPYYMPATVSLFGQEYATGRRGKRCIGLAMHAYGLCEDQALRISPLCKYATREIYNSIIALADRAGYDVVTINQPGMSVEHKAFLLNEYCDCLIGYEGGAAHLAHTLGVPCIILPWKYDGDGNLLTDPTDEMRLIAHSYHMDRRTYFPNTQEEITEWTPEQLRSCIDSLYQLQGNNRYYSPGVFVDQEKLMFQGTVYNDPFVTGELWRTREFIRQYNPDIRLY